MVHIELRTILVLFYYIYYITSYVLGVISTYVSFFIPCIRVGGKSQNSFVNIFAPGKCGSKVGFGHLPEQKVKKKHEISHDSTG